MAYSENDDDLFDYEYVEDQKTIIEKEITSEVSEFQNKVNIDLNDADLESTSTNLHAGKIQFALAYHKAYENFVYETLPLSVAKSFTIILDTLTNGDYSLITRFYTLEMFISRKLLFLKLSHNALKETDSDFSFFAELGKILHLDVDQFYIDNFFNTTLNICEFSVNLDRAEYLTLSKKLGIPVNQELFESWENTNEDKHDVYFEDFKKNVVKRIFETNIEHGMLDEVSTIFGRPVKVNNVEIQES